MGPYDLERETWSEPMPLAVKALHDAGRGKSGDTDQLVRNTKLDALLLACNAAGVELGDYDRRNLVWLARWDDATVQSVIGLISRAHEAGRQAEAPIPVYAVPPDGVTRYRADGSGALGCRCVYRLVDGVWEREWNSNPHCSSSGHGYLADEWEG